MAERHIGPIIVPAGKLVVVHHILGRSMTSPALHYINGESYYYGNMGSDTYFEAGQLGFTYGAVLGPFATPQELVLSAGGGDHLWTDSQRGWVVHYEMLTDRWTIGWNITQTGRYDDVFTEITVLDSVQGGAAPRTSANIGGLSIRVVPVDSVQTVDRKVTRTGTVDSAQSGIAGGEVPVASSIYMPSSSGRITRATVASTPLTGDHVLLNDESWYVRIGNSSSRDIPPSAGAWIYERWHQESNFPASSIAVMSNGDVIGVNNFGVQRHSNALDGSGNRTTTRIAWFPKYQGGPTAGQRDTSQVGNVYLDPAEEYVYVPISIRVFTGNKYISNLIRVRLSTGAISLVAGDENPSTGFSPTPAADGVGAAAHINTVLYSMAPVADGFVFADHTTFAGDYALRKVTFDGTVTTLTPYTYSAIPAIAYRPGEIIFVRQDGPRSQSGGSYMGDYSFMSLKNGVVSLIQTYHWGYPGPIPTPKPLETSYSDTTEEMDMWGGIIPSALGWDDVSGLFFLSSSPYSAAEVSNRRATVWAVNLPGDTAPFPDFEMEPFMGFDVVARLAMGQGYLSRDTEWTHYLPFGLVAVENLAFGPPAVAGAGGPSQSSSTINASRLRVTPRT